MVEVVVLHSCSIWTLIFVLQLLGVHVSSHDTQTTLPSATLGAVLLTRYHPLHFISLITCSDRFSSSFLFSSQIYLESMTNRSSLLTIR